MGFFYANNGMFGSHESDWLHHTMNVLVGLFRRYGVAANVANVTHNDIPARHFMGGDVGGGHGAEVHRGVRLIPSETMKTDTMPGVWS